MLYTFPTPSKETARIYAEAYRIRRDELVVMIERAKKIRPTFWIVLILILTPIISQILAILINWILAAMITSIASGPGESILLSKESWPPVAPQLRLVDLINVVESLPSDAGSPSNFSSIEMQNLLNPSVLPPNR